MKVDLPQVPSGELHYEHPQYLDAGSIERELRRVGEICHQCRRCLPLCPSFPRLFDLIDATPDEVATIAVRLAQNPDLRREIVAHMAANKHRLYFDRAPVAALEDLLEKSVRG